jgi:hypothetical protein
MAAHTCYLWSLICENSFCDCSGRVKKSATKRDDAPKRQRIHDPSSSSESEDEEYVPPSHTPVDDPFEDYEDEGEDIHQKDVCINMVLSETLTISISTQKCKKRHSLVI